MSHPILVTGAAGGPQGSTGRLVANLLKERLNPHALDHLTHLWQYFRRGEEHFQATDAIRTVTGRDPQTLEEFFKANAKAIGTGQN